MEKNELRAKLAKKITKIGDRIGKMEKDGTNDFSKYKYISYEKINAALRNLLDEENLAIIPEVNSYEEKHSIDAKGKEVIRTIVLMEFLLVDTETGYSEVRRFGGADQDTGGKSFAQAITECQKRFELKLFHISSQDDIICDPDSKTTEVSPMKKPATIPSVPSAPIAKKEQWDSIAMLLFEKDAAKLTNEEKAEMSKRIKSLGYSPAGLSESHAQKIIEELQK